MRHGQNGNRTLWILVVFVALLFASFTALSQQAEAKTGSYSLHFYGEVAPEGMTITVTAVSEDGTTYNVIHYVQGLTEEQARNLILTDLTDEGWEAEANGDNAINITGRTEPKDPISMVDIEDNQLDYDTYVDASFAVSEAIPGERIFEWVCALPNADVTDPGTLVLTLNEHTVTATLASGATPTEAATMLEDSLTSAGFVVTRVEDTVVALDWENATNAWLLSSPATITFGLEDGAAGPRVGLTLPDLAPIPTLSEWGLIIFALLVLTVITVVVRQRRTVIAKANA
ncbi:MAG TPA: IPTL-CTERM sorting domain-containing protein [Acidobacteriota bacterium]|nr:IPTL-CTERM sorting domain-containing protein [Acidobacteriota bacterium]